MTAGTPRRRSAPKRAERPLVAATEPEAVDEVLGRLFAKPGLALRLAEFQERKARVRLAGIERCTGSPVTGLT